MRVRLIDQHEIIRQLIEMSSLFETSTFFLVGKYTKIEQEKSHNNNYQQKMWNNYPQYQKLTTQQSSSSVFGYPPNNFGSENFPIINNPPFFHEENPFYEIVPRMMVNPMQMINQQAIQSFPEKRDKGVQCNFEELMGYYGAINGKSEGIKKQQIKKQGEPNSSDEEIEGKKKSKRLPETKNLIKNYGRSILSFISNNDEYRKMVLKELNIPEKEFKKVVKQFRTQVHTISGSRYLWQSHPYAKAFRIMACQYLRKHNLEHIFNSRISKRGIYLKYQHKIMRCLEQPQQFESIKDF